jgi:hypothetical protein
MQSTLDMNSPFVQQLMRTNPNMLAQLGLAQPSAPALTADAVQRMIDERIAAAMRPAQAPVAERLAQFEQVFQRALSAEDYAAFQQYVATGSPGFAGLLAGDKLHPIAQLLWETIKEAKA